VRNALPGLVRAGRRFDLVVMDPPRTGARDVLHEVTGLKAPHIAIVSCDPVTLARDLKRLARSGYQLVEVKGFDMFPHTHHLEALAWLRRQE
jgi:23S rRNA (uracil1939-C5)-methyltransferase